MAKQPNAQPHGGGGGAWAATNAVRALAAGEEITGTSVFDPVLCELAYRWFCPPGGLVLDPFAGGSVRGVVASRLGREYCGIDLSERQLAANEAQADLLCREGEPRPRWICGDARELGELCAGLEADFLFSCPPYWTLERYSDDPRDLSTLEDFGEFLEAYRAIVASAARRLKPDRFACFVVGDVRNERGNYAGLPWRTVEAFEAAGLALYNEAVLITASGSLALRTAPMFSASRKLGKTHQNVLVFCNGDPRAAAAAIGEPEFGELEAEGEAAPAAEAIGGEV